MTKKFTAPTSGLEDVYFTWGTVSDAARYTEVVDKLKEYVAVHFRDQATVAAKAMEDLQAPVFTKTERPVRWYWTGDSRVDTATNKTKLKRNASATTDNEPVLEEWEHKLEIEEYMESYKTHKGGTKAWEENKGKCYYLVLQHCPPELKTELKNSARWESAASDTDVVALLLIIRDVMHNKKEQVQSMMGLVESDAVLYTIRMNGMDTLDDTTEY